MTFSARSILNIRASCGKPGSRKRAGLMPGVHGFGCLFDRHDRLLPLVCLGDALSKLPASCDLTTQWIMITSYSIRKADFGS